LSFDISSECQQFESISLARIDKYLEGKEMIPTNTTEEMEIYFIPYTVFFHNLLF
jgi:hypothetical protein